MGADPVQLVDLGDPVVSDAFDVCVYDGATNLLVASILWGRASCAQGPCWKARGTTGFKWRDPLGWVSGINTFKAKAGDAGQARMVFKAKQWSLGRPLTVPVRVQVSRESGPCWEAIFSSPTLNTPEAFSASSD